jgi:hypothetical protein
MIPFRDNIPSLTTPFVTVSLIVVNSLAFVYELSLGPGLERFLYEYGVVPSNVADWPQSGQALRAVLARQICSQFSIETNPG